MVSLIEGKTAKPQRRLFAIKKPRVPKPPPEWRLQAGVVSEFHKLQDAGWKFEFAGDMNAGKRGANRAKICGVKAGETDLRIYLPRAVLKMIELKTSKGKLSDEQKERHAKLGALGFEVRTVFAATVESAVEQCHDLLQRWIDGAHLN